MVERPEMRKFAVLIISVWLLALPSVILVATGVVSPFVFCFSVDSQERLYVGLNGKIEVYEDGMRINEISPKTSRTYVFTISDEDKILLSNSSVVYEMDLNGQILDEWEDKGANTFNKLQLQKDTFVSSGENQYELRDKLGITQIIRNGNEVVYIISRYSIAVKLSIYLAAIGLILLAIIAGKSVLCRKLMVR